MLNSVMLQNKYLDGVPILVIKINRVHILCFNLCVISTGERQFGLSDIYLCN